MLYDVPTIPHRLVSVYALTGQPRQCFADTVRTTIDWLLTGPPRSSPDASTCLTMPTPIILRGPFGTADGNLAPLLPGDVFRSRSAPRTQNLRCDTYITSGVKFHKSSASSGSVDICRLLFFLISSARSNIERLDEVRAEDGRHVCWEDNPKTTVSVSKGPLGSIS
jgi:hypothetical protein